MYHDGLKPISEVLEQSLCKTPKSLPQPGKMPDSEYTCGDCQDFGFVHPRHPNGAVDYSRSVPCDCRLQELEEKRKAHLFKLCELPQGAEHMTFENFNVMAGNEEARQAAWELSQNSRSGLIWLTMCGPSDRGKTHLAIAACHESLKRGDPALYAFVPDLLRDLRRGFDNDDYDERFTRYCKVPLLVLDDLGAENATPWVQQELDSIVNARYMDRLPMIVTTNLAPGQLAPRIMSRLMRAEFGKVVTFTSGEYRKERHD